MVVPDANQHIPAAVPAKRSKCVFARVAEIKSVDKR